MSCGRLSWLYLSAFDRTLICTQGITVWNPYNITHLTLGMLMHYLGKLKIQIFCRYLADIKGNANTLHFKKLPIFEIRLSTSLLCIPSNTNFLSTSCPRRWLPCWLLTNTAVTSAVANFWCHKLIAKVKEQWHGKFYLQSVWRKTRYYKHRKYKICGRITKLEVIKMQFVCIFFHSCWISAEIKIFKFPK